MCAAARFRNQIFSLVPGSKETLEAKEEVIPTCGAAVTLAKVVYLFVLLGDEFTASADLCVNLRRERRSLLSDLCGNLCSSGALSGHICRFGKV